jgi:phosphate transport system substrate-binding protein
MSRIRKGGRSPGCQPLQDLERCQSSLAGRQDRSAGPPPTSGTRDAFVELVMDEGCEEFDMIKAMKKSDKKKFKATQNRP